MFTEIPVSIFIEIVPFFVETVSFFSETYTETYTYSQEKYF